MLHKHCTDWNKTRRPFKVHSTETLTLPSQGNETIKECQGRTSDLSNHYGFPSDTRNFLGWKIHMKKAGVHLQQFSIQGIINMVKTFTHYCLINFHLAAKRNVSKCTELNSVLNKIRLTPQLSQPQTYQEGILPYFFCILTRDLNLLQVKTFSFQLTFQFNFNFNFKSFLAFLVSLSLFFFLAVCICHSYQQLTGY